MPMSFPIAPGDVKTSRRVYVLQLRSELGIGTRYRSS